MDNIQVLISDNSTIFSITHQGNHLEVQMEPMEAEQWKLLFDDLSHDGVPMESLYSQANMLFSHRAMSNVA
jgi:hypothetical protein